MRGSRSLLATGSALLVIPLLSASPTRAAWPSDPNVNLPLSTVLSMQYRPVSVSDGAGGVIAAWYDGRGGNYHIYAQRVTAAGAVMWTADGVSTNTSTYNQQLPKIVSDGAGGAIVAWYESVSGQNKVVAQHVLASGAVDPAWPANGRSLCTAAGAQTLDGLVEDGAGGAVITWTDARTGAYDVYAQRVDNAGALLWAATGVAVSTAAGSQMNSAIETDGAGGAIITWWDYRDGATWDIYAQRVSAAGSPVWAADGVAICTAAGNQQFAGIAKDGSGGAIIAWEDARSDTSDIYAQRVNTSGVPQWTANGVPIAVAAGRQRYVVLLPDLAGGATLAWQDSRSGPFLVYAQRVNGSAASQWAANGVLVGGPGTANQQYPTIVTDDAGGAVIAWQDYRSGNTCDVYAQRINAAGLTQWNATGVAMGTAVGHQWFMTEVADGTGGVIATWADNRLGGSGWNIYAQRVSASGTLGREPVIDWVRDVPNDQGGRVRILWSASSLDTLPGLPIGSYGIWRRVTASVAQSALAHGATLASRDGRARVAPGVYRAEPTATSTTWWEGVGTVLARGDLWYTFVAETFQDSMAAGNPLTTFMVDAHAAFAPGYWSSAPDSGYSVDNLPPATPAPFMGQYAGGTTTLQWGANVESDLAGYRVYRGSTAGFPIGPDSYVASTLATTYVDVAGAPCHYKLVAVDAHGNASASALLWPGGTAEVEPGARATFALAYASAQPARGEASLAWTTPGAGAARLEILDVAGRSVRTLAAGRFGAGRHESAWDGRSDSGARLPPGLYLARLDASGRIAKVRIVLLD